MLLISLVFEVFLIPFCLILSSRSTILSLHHSNATVSNKQAPVVQTLDSAIHRINHYPAGWYYGNQLRYPLNSAIQSLNNRDLVGKKDG